VHRLALTLALLLPALPAVALDRPLPHCTVESWRAKDGLPGDSVWSLAQGADGRLWAATLGGVVRWDGRQWRALQGLPRVALADVSQLHAASDGSVWLLGPRRPVMRWWQGTTQTFGPAQGLPGEGRAWAESGGRVWVATTDRLYRFEEGRFVAHPAAPLSPALITALHVEPDGSIHVGTDGGLYTGVGSGLTRAPLVRDRIWAIHRDRRGTLWMAGGAWLMEGQGRVYKAQDGLPPGPITALADDRDGNLWIGTPTGLARLREGRISVFGTKDGLPDDEVTSLLVDREETLWVGTRRGGVAQFTDRTLETVPELNGIPMDTVCQAADGAMWFGTRGRGAIRWKDGQATFLGAGEGLSANIYAVLPDGPDGLWAGGPRGLFHLRGGKVEPFHDWPRTVTGLYRDRAGALWIAGNGELGRLTDRLVVFRPAEGLPAGQLRAVAEDPQGNLWVSAVGGLVRLQGDRFVPAALSPIVNGVRSILVSRDGGFWMSTVGKGLARVRGDRARFFNTASGLDPDRLSQLLEDDAQDLWIGAHNRITRVSRASLDAVAEGRQSTIQTLSFESTDRRAGILAERVRQPSAWKARDGRLWFITDQGPVIVEPHRVRANDVPPPVELEAVTLDGRAVPADRRESFGAGPGRLVVQYGAVSLLQPGRVRYRYRLEGVDRAWVEAGSARTATYPELRPGDYQFSIQASNNDGRWSEHGASFAFVLAAPFYRSTWFFAACGIAGLGAVIAAHRVRVARVRAQYVLLLAERTRMARELHDTLLQGMSAAALQLGGLRADARELPEPLQKDLAQMQDTLSRCLQETRQAVWDLREGGAGRPGDLGATLERMARRLCGAREVACDFRVEGTPATLPHAAEDELFRIGQEAVTNALRHAQARTITVRLCYDDRAVTLTISDDGTGFDPAAPAPEGHFGLAGMRERAARIGATLEVKSGPGTVVAVRVERS
jgi:signal transduction histidine kinase/ligand-binding sensor domain-containing protein